MAASINKSGEQHAVNRASLLHPQPLQFDFCEFFHGHTRASGWFSDRFGKPRRHFCGDFYGFYQDGHFILNEQLFYTDGVSEERQWKVSVSGNGVFAAESDSLINGAHGFVSGNQLAMSYSMKVSIEEGKDWDLDMKDLMVLQPDGSLHNITHVHKWGLRIGTVSTQYQHHDGDKLCGEKQSKSSASINSAIVERHLSSVGS